MENPERENEKHKTIERWLLDQYVILHVDGANPAVVLPSHLSGNRNVSLKVSKLFRGSLIVEREEISAELLFGNDYFTCKLPMSAIWGATDVHGKSIVWPADTPDEVLAALAATPSEKLSPPSDETGTTSSTATAVASNPAEEKLPRRGHLRRIK